MKLSHLIAASLLSLGAALPAAAHSIDFTAPLLGASESPANASIGKGSATVTLNEHTLTMRVQASFAGLSGAATMAHIHCCTALTNMGNTGVAVMFADFPTGGNAGTYDHTFDMSQLSNWSGSFVNAHGGTAGSAFEALGQALGNGTAYFNVHTSAFPGGELRGNFASAVPEPQTHLLMLVGLVGLASVHQRRRSA
ncbi:MAG: CHRD domain-containing protein [Rubrivivax sp.]|nr:MAG: CHRD domain-containing protein [Rubrivivax sp.]